MKYKTCCCSLCTDFVFGKSLSVSDAAQNWITVWEKKYCKLRLPLIQKYTVWSLLWFVTFTIIKKNDTFLPGCFFFSLSLWSQYTDYFCPKLRIIFVRLTHTTQFWCCQNVKINFWYVLVILKCSLTLHNDYIRHNTFTFT